MRKILFVLTCIVLIVVPAASAVAFELGVRGIYWFPDLSGDIKVDGDGISGTTLDLDDDLGLEEEFYPVLEIFTGIGKHHLSISYYNADYSASKSLNKDIYFNGKLFNINTLVESSLEYDVYDFMYQYDLLDLENILAGFSLGLVGKIKYFEGDVQLKSAGETTAEDFSEPIPLLGINFHVGLVADLLEARVLATGMGYSDGNLFDGQVEISITPLPFIDIHGGYRLFRIDVETDDITLDYETSGPYVSLTLSF